MLVADGPVAVFATPVVHRGHRAGKADCGHQRVAYSSCRNRSCPKCQGFAGHPISLHHPVEIDDVVDYRDGNRQKTMTLDGGEFIRRFLIHVLPGGFHRIRYFGFLGNCHRVRKLERCRELLGMAPVAPAADPPTDYRDRYEALTGRSLRQCPHCHTGIMVVIDCIARPQVCQPVPDTS